ncbi:MAG: porin, partial [Planctomycetota bacterium]|nr:porin [Planctomycetota bacterium]
AAFDKTGPPIGGRILTLFENSGDLDHDADPTTDMADFDVLDARVKITGGRGGYNYVMQFDAGSGAFGIDPSDVNGFATLDAYVNFSLGGDVSGRFGQFKPGISRNGMMSSGNLFFIDRTAIGAGFSGRAEGFMLHGDFEQLGWAITIQDGADTAADEYLIAGRVEFDLMGEGKADVEGAFGGSEAPSATVAVSFFDDGGANGTLGSDGTLLEFHAGTNVYSFGLDIMSAGDGFASIDGNLNEIVPDSTPISLFGTYMLQPETWEVGVRFQDFDNGNDGSKIDVGVTNYLDGHNLKWTFQYSTMDQGVNSFDLLGIQLQVGF